MTSGIFGGAFDTSMEIAISITVGWALIFVLIATVIIFVGRTKYRHLVAVTIGGENLAVSSLSDWRKW